MPLPFEPPSVRVRIVYGDCAPTSEVWTWMDREVAESFHRCMSDMQVNAAVHLEIKCRVHGWREIVYCAEDECGAMECGKCAGQAESGETLCEDCTPSEYACDCPPPHGCIKCVGVSRDGPI